MNVTVADPDARPVLVPAGNKVRAAVDVRKPVKKSTPEAEKKPVAHSNAPPQCISVPPPFILRRQERHQAVLKNLSSMNASYSSDASSTDSSTHSSGASSSGKVARRVSVQLRKKQCGPKTDKVSIDNVGGSDDADLSDSLEGKKRCAWVTPNTGIFVPYLFDLLLGLTLLVLILILETMDLCSCLLCIPLCMNVENEEKDVAKAAFACKLVIDCIVQSERFQDRKVSTLFLGIFLCLSFSKPPCHLAV